MKYLYVPADTFTVSSGDYVVTANLKVETITYSAETNTSEYFITKMCNNLKTFLNNNNYNYLSELSRNYYLIDTYNAAVIINSNTGNLHENNYWMYPLRQTYLYLNTYNFPITRTISIILNSDKLPIYTIDEMNVPVSILGSDKTMIIPAGSYNYRQFGQVIQDFVNTYRYPDQNLLNSEIIINRGNDYYNIQYFGNWQFIASETGSLVIYDNDDFNKYYGLLHLFYTWPDTLQVDTTQNNHKHIANMTPVNRTLHIPEGYYRADDICNYINNNNLYSYLHRGVNTIPFQQFSAKVVDNDLVIYTDDNTEFFINPICHLNTKQEYSWASEHRLCSFNEVIVTYNTEPYYIPEINITIDYTVTGNYTDLSNFSATGLPDGLTIDPVTGIISGAINVDNGIYKVNVTCQMGQIVVDDIFLNIKIPQQVAVIDNKFAYI